MGVAQREQPVTEILHEIRERLLLHELDLKHGGPEALAAAKLLHDLRLPLAANEYGQEKLEQARRQGVDEGFDRGFRLGFDTGYQARIAQERAESAPESAGVVVPLRPAISA